MDDNLAAQLNALPDGPGVYMHKDEGGRVLYVGKAKNLRSRVRSYFQPSSDHSLRIATMVRQVRDLEIIQTQTEAEALLLEASLIKKRMPRYNVMLKDDKSYPFFKLTVNELYPRLLLVREKLDKDAEYYGPYVSVRDARETLNMVNRHLKLRTSKMVLDGKKTYRPCLNFQLGKCLAPCKGDVDPTAYRELVDRVRMLFQGRDKELLQTLTTEMEAQSEAHHYEEAAQLRDAVRAIQRTLAKQLVVIPDAKTEQDVFGIYRESHLAGVQVLFVRHGRLIASDFMLWERTEGMSDGEIIQSVLRALYTRPSALLPREVLIPCPTDDLEIMEAFLSRERGSKVSILPVQRGPKKKLVEMAEKNARQNVKERISRRRDDQTVLEEVKRTLHLSRLPTRVEAFDISNIQGSHTVASMVVWEDNQPCKSDYRKYKIRSVEGPDDFKSMYEVLTRRYKRALTGEQPLPDLILIDGGKGQLNIAEHVLISMGIDGKQVDLIGLAKGRSEKRRGVVRENDQDLEYVVKPNRKNEIRLKRNSAVLHFLQRIRDESHRTAVGFHRTVRKKGTLRSELEDIPGLGKKRVQTLLRHFGSLRGVREASLEELVDVPGLPQNLAQVVFENFHPPDDNAETREKAPVEGA